MAALIPACVHHCPSQTPRLASREFISVCVTDREKAYIGQQAYARRCVFVRTCVCACVSV